MNDAEKKLAARLLNMAADEFANHGCNDLDLVKDVGLTPEEALEIQKSVHEWNGDADADPPQLGQTDTYDWMVMRWMAKRLAS